MNARFDNILRRGRSLERRAYRRLGQRYPTVSVNGYRMTMDLTDTTISEWLFMRRIWEPYESQLMTRVLRPGATVIDIGAHIGYYSLLAARRLGRQGHVLAFEPAPDNFALLARNIRQNGLGQIVHAENCAVTDQSGEVMLYLSLVNNGDHRVHPATPEDDVLNNWGRPRERLPVPAVSIDGYLQEHPLGPIDVIKMDVQGAELKVLQGMPVTLQQNPNVVLFVEYWPHGLKQAGSDPLDLLRFLTEQAGMSLFHIIPEDRRLQPIAVDELAARELDPTVQVDLVCSRNPAQLLATLSA